METKTLLTIVALLLAGMVTIMLARGDDRQEEDVFRSTAGEMTQTERAVADQPNLGSDGVQVRYTSYFQR